MRMFRPILALAFVVGVAGTPFTAMAQNPARQPAQVPIERVTALVASPFGGGASETRIHIGTAPNGIASSDLPPKPVTVLGGVATGSSRSVILVYPATEQDPAGSYMKVLGDAGWTHPPVTYPRSGFVPAGETNMRSGTLCRDSARVSVIPIPGAPSGRKWVRADFYTERGRSQCTAPPRTDFMQDFVYPLLEAPPGSRTVGTSGGGGSIDTREISTILQTSLAPAQLLAHYAGQLQKNGWMVGAPVNGDSISVQRVSARDTKGGEWTGALTVVDLGTQAHVSVQMARREGK